MFAVVVIGPPGSGKTAVLTALHDLLADDHVSHAVVEVEAVTWASPPVADEQSFRHLAAIRSMYAEAGYPLMLEAAPVTLQKRIVEREPPGWSGLPRLLHAADEIASTSRLLEDIDIVCCTDDTTPLSVAAQIRSARPALLLERSA